MADPTLQSDTPALNVPIAQRMGQKISSSLAGLIGPPSDTSLSIPQVPMNSMAGIPQPIRTGLSGIQSATQPFSNYDQPDISGNSFEGLVRMPTKADVAIAAASMIPGGKIMKNLRDTWLGKNVEWNPASEPSRIMQATVNGITPEGHLNLDTGTRQFTRPPETVRIAGSSVDMTPSPLSSAPEGNIVPEVLPSASPKVTHLLDPNFRVTTPTVITPISRGVAPSSLGLPEGTELPNSYAYPMNQGMEVVDSLRKSGFKNSSMTDAHLPGPIDYSSFGYKKGGVPILELSPSRVSPNRKHVERIISGAR